VANPYMQGSESITQAEHISPDKTGDNIQAKRVVPYTWNGSTWERASVGFSPKANITTEIDGDVITQTDGTNTYTVTIDGDTITEVWT
jgi:hypothetical protein